MAPLASRTLTTAIARPCDEVRAFLAEPWNFPKWASGLAGGLEPGEDGVWMGEGPGGRVFVRFAEPNGLGVADHWVTLADGAVIYVPLRTIASGDEAEVQLTLLQQPGMSLADFERDAQWVKKDLAALKALLEGG